jgi:hypothetical protein
MYMYSNWNYQNLPGKICNDAEAYIYWVLEEIIVVYHQKFQDLNINKSYICFANLMELEGISTKDLYTKTYFMS